MKAPEEIQNKRILFSPLNWGWGHVSRSLALLSKLKEQNNVIYLACSAEQRLVYQAYLENIEYLDLAGYPFRFNGRGKFFSDLVFSLPELYSFGKKEKKWVEEQVSSLAIDVVISDHRYYFHSDLVESIFVTHQLNLPLPIHLKPIQWLHRGLLNRFSSIWVVDDPKINLAGKLSEMKPWNQNRASYISLLSRFAQLETKSEKTWTTILISGPEVYANQFFEAQKHRIDEKDTCLVFRGKFYTKNETRPITWKEIDQILLQTKLLVARNGYSTLMDVYSLGCETEWHPTPGQWEQRYLFKYHQKKIP